MDIEVYNKWRNLGFLAGLNHNKAAALSRHFERAEIIIKEKKAKEELTLAPRNGGGIRHTYVEGVIYPVVRKIHDKLSESDGVVNLDLEFIITELNRIYVDVLELYDLVLFEEVNKNGKLVDTEANAVTFMADHIIYMLEQQLTPL